MEQDRTIMCMQTHINVTQKWQDNSMEKEESLTNDAGMMGYAYGKNEYQSIPDTIHKNQLQINQITKCEH